MDSMEHSTTQMGESKKEITETSAGHMMAPSDPDNPLNWPLHRRIYVSAVAFAFAFVVYVSPPRTFYPVSLC